jgi:hypothetical protein
VGPGLEIATAILAAILLMFLLVQGFCMLQTFRPGGIFSTPLQPQGGVRPGSDGGQTGVRPPVLIKPLFLSSRGGLTPV